MTTQSLTMERQDDMDLSNLNTRQINYIIQRHIEMSSENKLELDGLLQKEKKMES